MNEHEDHERGGEVASGLANRPKGAGRVQLAFGVVALVALPFIVVGAFMAERFIPVEVGPDISELSFQQLDAATVSRTVTLQPGESTQIIFKLCSDETERYSWGELVLGVTVDPMTSFDAGLRLRGNGRDPVLVYPGDAGDAVLIQREVGLAHDGCSGLNVLHIEQIGAPAPASLTVTASGSANIWGGSTLWVEASQ